MLTAGRPTLFVLLGDPVYMNTVERIHAVDGIAGGDSNRPRSALVFSMMRYAA